MGCTPMAHAAKAGSAAHGLAGSSTTSAILELAGQLAGQGIQRVGVQSASDSWRLVGRAAGGAGTGRGLVNAHDVKQLPGPPGPTSWMRSGRAS
jgi:transposase